MTSVRIALVLGSILGCLGSGCGNGTADTETPSGPPPDAAGAAGAVGAANSAGPGAEGPGAEGGEETGEGTSAPVICGPVQPWDSDGDGVSDATEANNAESFSPSRCDSDPSEVAGTFYSGRLNRGVNLTDRGSGYIHLRGSDPVDGDDWASLALVACVETVGRAWEATGRRINVNDLSLQPGGRFRPHRSHQNGLDADLRYVRKDGRDAPLDLRRNPEAYDALATQELFRLFLQHCDVSVLFVDTGHLGFGDRELDPGRAVLAHAPGHSNHFHLRLKPPTSRTARVRRGLDRFSGLGLFAGLFQFPMAQAQPPLTRRPLPAQAQMQRPRPSQAAPGAQAGPGRPAAPLLVQRSTEDRRTILRGDAVSRSATVLYRSKKDVVYGLAVSADNRFTAALESTDGVVEEAEYVVPPRNELVVLDTAGKVVRRVTADVQQYRFSPDGRRIAYVTGTHYEGGVGFVPEGVFILDIASGATERVAAENVYELDWGPAREGTLMLRALAAAPARRVLSYDARNRRISAVPSGGFQLSPDGQFFLKQPHELMEEGSCQPGVSGGNPSDCFQVVDRRTGRPAPLPSQDLGKPVSWVGGEGHLLLFSKQEQANREQTLQLGGKLLRGRLPAEVTRAESHLWDPARSEVVRKVPGAATGERPGVWIGSPDQLVLEKVPERSLRARPVLERLIVEPVKPPR